ncbi:hypothetical protein AbraIFM66950_001078 [Aspergillus brasiliensis]|nr:hypothetical protein AbraIFM66950_001078 [Aspergillus brasiliensis]
MDSPRVQLQLHLLPSEIIYSISEHLDGKCLCYFRLANKRLGEIARGPLYKTIQKIALAKQELYDRQCINQFRDQLIMCTTEVGIPALLLHKHADVEVFAALVNRGAYEVNRGAYEVNRGAYEVNRGAYDAVKLFLDAGVSANAFDLMGRTMLHLCVFNGDVALAQLLLDRGADPNLTMHNGWSPLHILHFAPFQSQKALAWALLDRGVVVPDNVGLLFSDICRATCALEIVQYLVEGNLMDIGKPMDYPEPGTTALHIAAKTVLDLEVLEYLLSVKPSLLNMRTTHYLETAYTFDGADARPLNAAFLIRKGIDLAGTEVAINPRRAALLRLNAAVKLGHLGIIRALLARDELRGWGDKDWIPDMKLRCQLMPLEHGITEKNLEALELLLKNRNFSGAQALIEYCQSEIIKITGRSRSSQARRILRNLRRAMST